MTSKRWTIQEKIELIKLRQQNLPIDEIVVKLGKPISAVLNRCHRSNVNRNNVTPTEQAVLALVTLAARAGEPCPTNYEIAAQSGLTATEVARAIRSLSAAGVMEVCLNKRRRRVAYIYKGFLSTKDANSKNEPAFHVAHSPGDAEEQIKLSSMALLRRQLETGAHWIKCPQQFRAACESVGLEVAA